MDENQKKTTEFDDLFKQHTIEPKPEKPGNTRGYTWTIIYYLLIMFVFATFVAVITTGIDSAYEIYDQNEIVLENVAASTSGFTLIRSDIYASYEDQYKSYVDSLGQYDQYEVIVNISNILAYDYLLLEDDTLDLTNVVSIIDGTRVYWDDAEVYEIELYESALSAYPTLPTNAETRYIAESQKAVSNFAGALVNFITYMALTPVLAFVLLRREITADLLVYKNKWNEFIPAVLIGYALALVGNFVANFLSTSIAPLFGEMQSTAANQMVIQQSLQSNGMIFIFLSAVILGPIAEELVFRKAIFGLIKHQYVALVVSAIIFGGIHLLGEVSLADAVINGIVYITLGFVFGYIYIRNKKNIAVNIAVHILYNFISVLMVLLLF